MTRAMLCVMYTYYVPYFHVSSIKKMQNPFKDYGFLIVSYQVLRLITTYGHLC
jgi:hypothetical protein